MDIAPPPVAPPRPPPTAPAVKESKDNGGNVAAVLVGSWLGLAALGGLLDAYVVPWWRRTFGKKRR